MAQTFIVKGSVVTNASDNDFGRAVFVRVTATGDTTGDTYYSGTALVTGFTRTASFDGMVEASITVQGSGALTTATA